jgi:hypothetical protein
MDYSEIYALRVNRYGHDFQSRVQGEREKLFENFLLKSIYRVDFMYESELQPGSLEPNKQDKTQTLQYLLTRLSLEIPNGTALDINEQNWMVYYKEEIAASGYNRYIVLKMSHEITWVGPDGKTYTSPGYIYSGMTSPIIAAVKSNSSAVVYNEFNNSLKLIFPYTPNIDIDSYVKVNVGTDNEQQFRVTGLDSVSTIGVHYVTLDPIYKYDETPAPPYDGESDGFWLYGGDTE